MTPITERPVLALLRLEGIAAFAGGAAGYVMLTDGWLLFAAVALVPDLAMIGYAFGNRAGARLYNLAHTYLVPALLAAAGLWALPALLPVACAWLAHIGIDRALGFGLKSETAFGLTHLGRIGRAA
ncbi:DUF4260 domain-containing protein [Frigidibacter sp. ROC022]|uniref:DUF4260 domain-containing protein n=1 Tax=Frigidibacter sp. ROC022 TaxID=2971796 RepID=UPI00215AA4E2|nr:DUF4260 domain-containing protein [Frigidibacter sp. ROC022]MCR8723500.1 DUF4260 domain-containing protein [Frigidibacter sp. ROC022]